MTELLSGTAYQFQPLSLAFSLTGLLMLLLAGVVYRRQRGSRVGLLFAAMVFLVGIWLGSFGLMLASHTGIAASLWARAGMMGVIFLPATVYSFTVTALRNRHRRIVMLSVVWGAASLFAVLALGTEWLVGGVRLFDWGFYPAFGPAATPFLFYFFGTLGTHGLEYLAEYRRTIDVARRSQIRRLLFAFLLVYVSSYDFLPMLGWDVHPIGYIPILAFLAYAGNSIRRHRLKLITPAMAAREILDTMADALVVVDAGGRIRVVNSAVCDLLGYEESELLGKPFAALEAVDAENPASLSGLFRGRTVRDEERRYCSRDGRKIDVSISISPLMDREIAGAVVIARDIRERKRSEQERREALEKLEKSALERERILEALKESEERYALSAQGANDGLWVWDVRDDSIYFSPRWKSMLGFADEQIGSAPEEWFERVHEEDLPQLMRDIEQHQRGESDHLENEHRILHRSEGYRWVLCRGLAVRDEQGQAVRIAGSQTDIHNRKMAEEQLLHDAFHDRLTDLPNRSLFMDRLQHAMQRRRHDSQSLFCVLFLDLDRFKVVNDSLGHAVGDGLLIEVANRLVSVVRDEDTVARLGGDEFAILLEELDNLSDAVRTTQRILSALREPFAIDGNQIYTSAGVGLASSTSAYERPADLLRDADIAMYRAKSAGRSRYEVFDRTMHEQALRVLQLETELRRAVEEREFEVYYQPIVDVETRNVLSLEALLRWNDGGRVRSAGELIPLAEETGLIHEIGEWVLRAACEQLLDWRRDKPAARELSVSVNLSARQFLRPDLATRLTAIVDDAGIERDAIVFEITESAVMEDSEAASLILDQLRDAGFRLGLDDFGTGFSSLSMLHEYPFQIVKIDQSFIRSSVEKERGLEIMRTMVTLGRALGMSVVVEGVELEEQLELLRLLEVRVAQGFYFSRPLNTQTMSERLESGAWSSGHDSADARAQ